MEAAKTTTPETGVAEIPAPPQPSLGSGEAPPIPAAHKKPAPALLRDASGDIGPIPFLTDTSQAETSQLIYTLNNLIAAINARLGLIQPSAVKPAQTVVQPAAHPAAQKGK